MDDEQLAARYRKALEHILEASAHRSLTVNSTAYMAEVARKALNA